MEIPRLPEIPESERTPAVIALLAVCKLQQERITAQQEQITAQQEQLVKQAEQIHLLREQVQSLKDEIARLKGQKAKPDIKPSKLEESGEKQEEQGQKGGKRAGWSKRSKTGELEIHETVIVQPNDLPAGSQLKDYQDYTVQDIVLRPHNTCYRLERWQTPDGTNVMGKLPAEVQGHFGLTVVSFILYQYYHAHVTQPLILEMLLDFGVDISAGQVNRIITEGKERFHEEKDAILRVGLEVSGHIHVDDTGARHQGKNGYCTHMGNQMFAWFQTTESKSRINFLELLRAGRSDYVLNDIALEYMRDQKLPQGPLAALTARQGERFDDKGCWEVCLAELGLNIERHVRIATEGALLGSVIEGGVKPDLGVVSDDAGQFNVLAHALCWIHADRILAKLVGFNDGQREDLETVRTQVWDLYQVLKVYKRSPSEKLKVEVAERFDEIFTQKTCFATLNETLKRLYRNKSELLLVLERPDIPLHNNESERDIREYVKKRKISGSTRSDLGRRCRDTFASLKKTCRKLGVSFWVFLKDRLSGSYTIPPLPELIRQRAQEVAR